jgi:hypothetical protein
VPRKPLSRFLVALAALSLGLALVIGYADRTIFSSTQFADRATDALERGPVKSKVADAVTDDVVLKADADLIGVRPLIHSVAENVIGSSAFRTLFHRAVEEVHRSFFNRDGDAAGLALADVGTLLTEGLKQASPGAAPKIAGRISRVKIHLEPPSGFTNAVERLESLRFLPLALLLGGIVSAVGGVALARDRRRSIVALGVGIAASGIALLLAYHVIRAGVLHRVPTASRAAGSALWSAFGDGLRDALFIYAGAGAVLAAAAASVVRPVELGAPLRRAWRLVETVPESTPARLARAAALVGAGIFVIADRALVLELVLLSAGAYLIYAGVAEALRVLSPATDPEVTMRRRRLIELAVAGAVAVVVIGGAATAYVTSGSLRAPGDEPGTCNGFRALCDRRLNQVALAGTHNSMSAASEPGWLFANQAVGIAAQLDDGIHALLWDSYYGRPTPAGDVKTVLSGGLGREKRRQYVELVGRRFLDAALRIRDRLPSFKGTGAPVQMYLCHRFCETGALPLSDALSEVRDFLVAHPAQVLVIINEDYVKPADYVDAVRKAGLASFVYKGPTGPWPTLGEMIDSNQRLVLLAENHGGGAPWYHPAYRGIVQETPYTFTKPSQLIAPAELRASCVPNRGGRRGSLFLLNHFITKGASPRPSLAAKVNAYRALLRRTRRCDRLRDALPNVVAVDFATVGGVIGVANALNRVGGGSR